jgi:hypothetical protein
VIFYVYFVVDINFVETSNYVEVICLHFAGPAPLLASAERVDRARLAWPDRIRRLLAPSCCCLLQRVICVYKSRVKRSSSNWFHSSTWIEIRLCRFPFALRVDGRDWRESSVVGARSFTVCNYSIGVFPIIRLFLPDFQDLMEVLMWYVAVLSFFFTSFTDNFSKVIDSLART